MTRRLLPLALLCLLCQSGCLVVDFTEGQTVAVDNLAKIVPGTTTKQQILDWFGAPQGIADAQFLENYLINQELAPGPVVNMPYADVLVFRFTHGKGRGIIAIVWNWFELHIASDTLIVFFDADDRVLYYGFRKGTDDLPR